MARAESKMVMGYLPIDPHHHAAIMSLVMPATPVVKLLDPFAGDGAFLEVAAQAWNVTPYANELDGERAQVCIERFGRHGGGCAWSGCRVEHASARHGHSRMTRQNRESEQACRFAYGGTVGNGARRRDGTVVYL